MTLIGDKDAIFKAKKLIFKCGVTFSGGCDDTVEEEGACSFEFETACHAVYACVTVLVCSHCLVIVILPQPLPAAKIRGGGGGVIQITCVCLSIALFVRREAG